MLSKSQQLISFVILMMLAALLGWFSSTVSKEKMIVENASQNWKIPELNTENLSVLNNQLSTLKVWISLESKATAKEAIPDWRLVGITQSSGQFIALVELKDIISLQRLSAGDAITTTIKLLSVSKGSITIETAGNEQTILLYQ